MEKFYGDITPDQFDTDYVCDEIDAVNSDLDIAIPIYSGRPLETDNPNIPHIFTAVGADDNIGGMNGYDQCIDMFLQMREIPNVNPELHIYGRVAKHPNKKRRGKEPQKGIQTSSFRLR